MLGRVTFGLLVAGRVVGLVCGLRDTFRPFTGLVVVRVPRPTAAPRVRAPTVLGLRVPWLGTVRTPARLPTAVRVVPRVVVRVVRPDTMRPFLSRLMRVLFTADRVPRRVL